jgi:hypothetical protein
LGLGFRLSDISLYIIKGSCAFKCLLAQLPASWG